MQRLLFLIKRHIFFQLNDNLKNPKPEYVILDKNVFALIYTLAVWYFFQCLNCLKIPDDSEYDLEMPENYENAADNSVNMKYITEL